jgi:hypothetical protein
MAWTITYNRVPEKGQELTKNSTQMANAMFKISGKGDLAHESPHFQMTP